jgi:spoIIIJ-associated protein
MGEPRTSLEIIAETVEQAINQGSAQLGLPRESFEIEVLDEGGKGMFGLGTRQARVRLTVRESGASPAASPPAGDDDFELAVSRDTVIELIKRLGYSAQVDARWLPEEPDEGGLRHIQVDVHGDDLSLLIGRGGETLAALQYITRLIVGRELEQPAVVTLDVEGYRARREQQLRQLARRMAEQAIERKRTMSLEPMPASERRIIHIELRNNPQVSTESVGEGSARKVTIIPRS